MISYLSKAKPKTLQGTALLRLDFNTKDDWRMRAVLPTLKLLMKTSEKIVIVSHYGRPTPLAKPGKDLVLSPEEKKFSLKKDAARLVNLLGEKVIFIQHFNFAVIQKQIADAPHGSIFLLENLRFIAGEEKNDPKFAARLAGLANFYVNDAFAVSHRANASVAAITKLLPSYAGLEMELEITSLTRAIKKPGHPFVFIVGGAKASDKLEVVSYFKNKADHFLLGGGAGNTVLKIKGFNIKQSIADNDPEDLKKLAMIAKLKTAILPVDFAWSKERILDIGPKTAAQFSKIIAGAKTIVWSGPMGLIEKKPYDKGSLAIARAVTRNRGAFSLTGGGETVTFLKKNKFDTKFSFISTGGGAMLDFLAGKKLPGIVALEKRK